MSREFFDSPPLHGEIFVANENSFCPGDSNPAVSAQATGAAFKKQSERKTQTATPERPPAPEQLELTNPYSANVDVHPQSEYKVHTGDTLWGIARKELKAKGNSTPSSREIKSLVQEIIDQNKADYEFHPGQLMPGTALRIPFGDGSSSINQKRPGATIVEKTESTADYQPKTMTTEPAHHHRLAHVLDLERRIARGVIKFGKSVIDDTHHWLASVAAVSFCRAEKEALQHGVHIQVSSAGRTYADQARLYRQLHRHQAVALPGTSNHETGLAVDVINWQQAKPYLLAHGFVHGDGHGALKNDPWHFKYAGV
jgi:hypothetical protein